MTRKQCVYCLMKAISCYTLKDSRMWCYLYECCVTYVNILLAEDYIIVLDCNLVRLVRYSDRVPRFIAEYACDLQNAVLGYDFVLTPDYWIAQLQSLLNVSISDDPHKFGYGCVGDKVKLHIIFNVKE